MAGTTAAAAEVEAREAVAAAERTRPDLGNAEKVKVSVFKYLLVFFPSYGAEFFLTNLIVLIKSSEVNHPVKKITEFKTNADS